MRKKVLASLLLALPLALALANVGTASPDGWITPASVEDSYLMSNTANTIDSNTSTYSGVDGAYAWIAFDLGASYTVTKIQIYQVAQEEFGADVGVTVYISDDTGNWGDAVWSDTMFASGADKWVESGSFNKTGRYVKVKSEVNQAGGQKMFEFQAYAFGWYEVETWTNYLENAPPTWKGVENWTNYAGVLSWQGVENWSNYLDAYSPAWQSVENWTDAIQTTYPTMGYASIGENKLIITDTVCGSKFIAPTNGRIDNITVYLDFLLSGKTANINCAIYDENINLTSQADNRILANDGWYTFTFSVPPILADGMNYYFVAWADAIETPVTLRYTVGVENQSIRWEQTYSDNFPVTMRPPDNYFDYKISIYTNLVSSASPVLPSKPVLTTPSAGETVDYTETPTFSWPQCTNAKYYDLIVDTVIWPDWKNLVIFERLTDNFYTVSFEMEDDNYAWRVYAVNDNGRNESAGHSFYLRCDAHISTEDASDVGPTNATLNAEVTDFGKYDNVLGRFDYRPYRSKVWGENWFLSDLYYQPPESPADIYEWGNRTPVKYLAAIDSSAEDKSFVAEQGENGYQCNGENDEVDIQDAIDTFGENGGKIYLFDGTYYLSDNEIAQVKVRQNITLVGESTDGTVIVDNGGASPPVRMFNVIEDNILIENLTFIGQGRSLDKESSALHIQTDYPYDMDTFNIVVRNVITENFAAIGIYIEKGGATTLDNIWVENCIIKETGNQGIAVSNGTHIYVCNNVLTNVGLGTPSWYGFGNGILVWSVVDGIVANNVIENTGEDGIIISNYPVSSPCSNVIVQGNLIVNGGMGTTNRHGIYVGGNEEAPVENIVLRGNQIIDNLADNMRFGIYFATEWAENFIIDNNNLVMAWEPIIAQGTGHIIENNIGLYTETNWQMVNSPTSVFSENIENLERNWIYQYRASISTYDNELESGDTILFQLFGWVTAEIWTVYPNVPFWQEIAVWTNYIKADTWYEVATWTNQINAQTVGWWNVGTWTNYLNVTEEEPPPPPPPEWCEVGTWTNYASSQYPEWQEVETWINYVNATLCHILTMNANEGTTTPSIGEHLYAENTPVEIIAHSPGTYWNWNGWVGTGNGSYTGTDNPAWVTMYENIIQQATWKYKPPEFDWVVFIIRFFGIIGPLGFVSWKFTKVKDPASGTWAAIWTGCAFIAIILLWFVADAIDAILSAI